MHRRRVIAAAAAGLALPLLPRPLRATTGPQGLIEPQVFAPFDPAAPACRAPRDLDRKLVFARDNDRDFIDGVDHGLALAAADRGLAYEVVNAQGDAARMMSQLAALQDQRLGGLVIAPVDAGRAAPELTRLLASGTYVGAIVPPPATTILNAPQYLTGKVLGDAAVGYIRERLDGKAHVVLLTHDSLEFLAPRFAAMRDCLRALPGVEVVADISPLSVDEKGGFATMTTILMAEPQIDVVLGADTVVLGALAAMRAAGQARPDQFFGGIDGEPEAVAELQLPGSPYKASVSLASAVFGYAMAQHAADWIEGKSIPKAIDVLPALLTPQTLAGYAADMADPGAVFRDLARRDRYLRFYGNTCFDQRADFVNFPWTSERPRQD